MIRYFKTFFYPETIIYSYSLPIETVLSRIAAVLEKRPGLLGYRDIKGRFLNSNTFAISTISLAYATGVNYGSRLTGQVVQTQNGSTQIKTKVRPGIGLYILFFATLLFGIAYLIGYFKSGTTGFLPWSLALMVFGPAISIGFSKVAIASIHERYREYIDKELKA